MNSSTSNSNAPVSRPPSLGRVALVLLLLFGALELFTRGTLVEASRDLRRFHTYPARAQVLHSSAKPRVAVLGNSCAEAGVDPRILQNELRARGTKAATDVFTADASHLSTWEQMANALFWSPHRAPDWLVVPFFKTSLADQNSMEMGRVAQFFTPRRDFGRVLRQLPDTGARLEFAVSGVWATYAARDRLKERVLSLLLPDYRNFTTDLQSINQPASRNPDALTYRSLERFLTQARAQNCRVVFVAMPLRDTPYPIAPELRAQLQKSGAPLLDLQGIKGMKRAFYADSIHLNTAGKALLTPRLASELAGVKLKSTTRRGLERSRRVVTVQ